MIKWTDIDNEVEEFQSGYRSGFVSIFKQYEGQETDEVDARNRKITVNVATFSARYGIADTTFRRWLSELDTTAVTNSRPANFTERMNKAREEAATKAKAEAEAEGLERAKAEAERVESVRLEAERSAKAERYIAVREARAEEQRKYEASELKLRERLRAEKLEALARLEKQLKEEASHQEFDLNNLTQAQKAEVMTLLANDPDEASEWFKAQTKERARKLAAEELKSKEAAAKRREQMNAREARQAAEKARSDYEGSALRKLKDLANLASECKVMLNEKPITFDNILSSSLSAQQWVDATELVEDVAVDYREAIFSVNAEIEMADIKLED